MKLRVVHRFPMICFMTEKTSARRLSDKGSANCYHLKWDSLLSNEVGKIAQHIGERKRNKRKEENDSYHITL
jgi:hypothetical protein